MTGPFAGLEDRTRVMTRVQGSDFISSLEVDELIIGGTIISASQGTRYANGRLTFQGRGDNSIEVELKPGFGLSTRGVVAQIIWYASDMVNKFKRFGISIVKDGSGADDESVVVDSTRSANTHAMPVYGPVMGGMSNPDGTDVAGKDKNTFSYFQDGSHEFHLRNDTLRVEIASFVEAFISGDRTKIRARKLVDGSWEQTAFDNSSFDEL